MHYFRLKNFGDIMIIAVFQDKGARKKKLAFLVDTPAKGCGGGGSTPSAATIFCDIFARVFVKNRYPA